MAKIVGLNWKWGRALLYLILGIVTIMFIISNYGCAFKKKITKTPEKPETQQTAPKKVPTRLWYRDMDTKIKVGDPIVLYNEYKILCHPTIPKGLTGFKDGKYIEDNRSLNVNYDIEAFTAGKLVHVYHQDGLPSAYQVQFILGSDNGTYTFFVDQDGTFYQDANITLKVDGIEHQMVVSVEGPSQKNRLFVDDDIVDNSKVVDPLKTGVDKPIGTKIIEEKK